MTGGPTERDAAFERLREAYMDLEAAKPLRELGRSASFIGHEIKNYMMVISGYAALLLRSKKLDGKDRAMADNISAAAAKLYEFSVGVLELSRPEAASGEEEVELARLFRQRAPDISISCGAPQNTLFVNGYPEKLERLLDEALRNSFEAGARNVSVRLSAFGQMALIVIEDDGAGCNAEQLPNLSKTFFTTKRGCDTGLGLCAIRSIVEAHNGSISIYAKNILSSGKHGLSIQILLPASKNTPREAAKAEVMLVKDGLSGMPKIMKMLKNLKIIPRAAEQAKDIGGERQNSSLELVIIIAASKVDGLGGGEGGGKVKVLRIKEVEGGALLAANNDDNGVSNWELFTEEYIINCLL